MTAYEPLHGDQTGQAMPAGVEDAQAEPKAFKTMAARAALRGWQLWRSDAADGPRRYFAGRWGLVRVLADLEDVERFLELVGARP